MATITFEGYMGAGPAWADLGANTVVFAGSLTDLTVPIATTDWNDCTHAGADDPGADQCGANHMNNVKYLTGGTMSVNGGGSEAISDVNLAEAECTMRIHLNSASTVATQNTFFYSFNGAVVTTEAVEIECYAFERGVTATAWTQINDDSGNIGGDNAGERLDLGEKTSAIDHYWFLALSARGESAGGKTSFDFGFKTEIF